jgi:hypothetical protein
VKIHQQWMDAAQDDWMYLLIDAIKMFCWQFKSDISVVSAACPVV